MSILVTGWASRENAKKEKFISLQVMNSLPEMVKSKSSGKFYCVFRRCSIPSTCDEKTASMLVGTKIPGEIVKIPCEAYEYETANGEKILLDFEYQYRDTGSNVIEEKIFN